MEKKKLNGILKLLVSIIICQSAGFIGSFFTTPAIPTWYATLNKPFFTPPNGIFSPVWISLYVLMGVSAFFVWNKGLNVSGVKRALIIFGIQLILNPLWSLVFFGLRSPVFGFIEISILWIFIFLTLVNFFKMSRIAGFLLLPYIFWVSFAALLNFSIWRLNI